MLLGLLLGLVYIAEPALLLFQPPVGLWQRLLPQPFFVAHGCVVSFRAITHALRLGNKTFLLTREFLI